MRIISRKDYYVDIYRSETKTIRLPEYDFVDVSSIPASLLTPDAKPMVEIKQFKAIFMTDLRKFLGHVQSEF